MLDERVLGGRTRRGRKFPVKVQLYSPHSTSASMSPDCVLHPSSAQHVEAIANVPGHQNSMESPINISSMLPGSQGAPSLAIAPVDQQARPFTTHMAALCAAVHVGFALPQS